MKYSVEKNKFSHGVFHLFSLFSINFDSEQYMYIYVYNLHCNFQIVSCEIKAKHRLVSSVSAKGMCSACGDSRHIARHNNGGLCSMRSQSLCARAIASPHSSTYI